MFHLRQACIVFVGSLIVLLLSGCGQAPELNVVATLDQAPGNITITPDKRIIISLHQFFSPDWRVAEWTHQGIRPFPNPDIASSNDPDITLHSVLGIQSDSKGIVWMLDNGMRGSATPKLLAWDTRQNKLHKVIMLPDPLTPADAFVNDLAVDETHNSIYITDPAGGDNAALIVVDISTPLMEASEITNIISVTEQLTNIMTRSNTDAQLATLIETDIRRSNGFRCRV